MIMTEPSIEVKHSSNLDGDFYLKLSWFIPVFLRIISILRLCISVCTRILFISKIHPFFLTILSSPYREGRDGQGTRCNRGEGVPIHHSNSVNFMVPENRKKFPCGRRSQHGPSFPGSWQKGWTFLGKIRWSTVFFFFFHQSPAHRFSHGHLWMTQHWFQNPSLGDVFFLSKKAISSRTISSFSLLVLRRERGNAPIHINNLPISSFSGFFVINNPVWKYPRIIKNIQ